MAGINNCINNSANVFSSTTTITAGTGLTCTLNDILATSGNFVATAGSLSLGAITADAVASTAAFKKSRAAGVITTGDALGTLSYQGHDGTGYTVGAKITSVSVGTQGTATRLAGNLLFYTHPDSVAADPSLRMTIEKTGCVTIAAPDAGVALTITDGGLTVTSGTVTLTPLGWGAAVVNGGTHAVSAATPGAAGTVLMSNGATALPTFQSPAAGFVWGEATADIAPMLINNGYIANKASTPCSAALPATSAVGSVLEIVGKGATGWIITQAANQHIIFGNVSSTVGATGTVASALATDTIALVCITADLVWTVRSAGGNLVLA